MCLTFACVLGIDVHLFQGNQAHFVICGIEVIGSCTVYGVAVCNGFDRQDVIQHLLIHTAKIPVFGSKLIRRNVPLILLSPPLAFRPAGVEILSQCRRAPAAPSVSDLLETVQVSASSCSLHHAKGRSFRAFCDGHCFVQRLSICTVGINFPFVRLRVRNSVKSRKPPTFFNRLRESELIDLTLYDICTPTCVEANVVRSCCKAVRTCIKSPMVQKLHPKWKWLTLHGLS